MKRLLLFLCLLLTGCNLDQNPRSLTATARAVEAENALDAPTLEPDLDPIDEATNQPDIEITSRPGF